MTVRERIRESVNLFRQWGLTSGRDMVATTRDSFVSVEGRAGGTVFIGLWVLGRWQAGPWSVWGPELGGEIVPSVRVWYAGAAVGGQVLLLGVHVLFGALWGIAVKNALGLAARLWPRFSVHRLSPWIAGVFSGGIILVAHGILFMRDVARHPALYQETLTDRGGWAAAFQRVAVQTDSALWRTALTAGIVVGIAMAVVELGIRFYRWWMGFSRPTRLAAMVLGGGLVVFLCGVWGVRWIQAERNHGPNLLFISIDGWRPSFNKTSGDLSQLKKNGRGPCVQAGTVAPSADLSPVLATALSGLSPLTHGVRHDFESASDGPRGDNTLPGLFKKSGGTTVLLADGPSGFVDRMAGQFDWRWGTSSHAAVRLCRRLLERSPHVLPYVSGAGGRRLGLRGSVFTADPALLADEVNRVLGRLKHRPHFFLWVHFSSPGAMCATVSPRAARRLGLVNPPLFRRPGRGFEFPPLTGAEEIALRRAYAESLRQTHGAVRQIFDDLARRRMDASTAVVVWSPRAALLSSDELARARRLDGPAFDGLPFYAWEGPTFSRDPAGPFQPDRRAVDVAPTAARLVGVEPPAMWEGVSMTDPRPEGEEGVVFMESNVPNQEVARGLGLPSPWDILVEDRGWPGRFRRHPDWEDPFLIFRDRALRLGSQRVSYRPGLQEVDWAFESVVLPTVVSPWILARFYKEKVKELKDIFFRTLSRESGWRPQNDYWIPESFLRERPLPLVLGDEETERKRRPRFWTDSK